MEVKKLLQILGITSQQLAEIVGVSGPRISEYTTGKHKITLHRLRMFCEKTGVDIKDVI